MGSGEGRGLESKRLLPKIPEEKHTGENRKGQSHHGLRRSETAKPITVKDDNRQQIILSSG